MNSDQARFPSASARTAGPDDQQQQGRSQPSPREGKLDLSVTQILGGALAAMTAAALGSRLGVAGTITGAAVASVVAGVAGSVYTASLRHTREKVATVITSRRGEDDSAQPAPEMVPQGPAWPEPARRPAPEHRASQPLRWAGVVVAAVATFAVAIVALTGFEALAGSALSGGRGTTIEQVTGNKPAKHSDSKGGSTASPSKSDHASETSSPKASETPSSSATEPSSPATTDQPSSHSTAPPSSNPKTTAATERASQQASQQPSASAKAKSSSAPATPAH